MTINSQVGIEGLDLVQTPNGYKTVGGVRSHQLMCVMQRQAMVRFSLLTFCFVFAPCVNRNQCNT